MAAAGKAAQTWPAEVWVEVPAAHHAAAAMSEATVGIHRVTLSP